MKQLLDNIKAQPVAVYGMVLYGLFLATEYGLPLDTGQQAAVLGFTAYALTLYTRQKVTPLARPRMTETITLVPEAVEK